MPHTPPAPPRPRAMQVAELDLDLDALGPPPHAGPHGARGAPTAGVLALRPGPGGAPVGPGDVFVLVRHRGRPVGTLTATVPDGSDPAEVLAAAARDRLVQPPAGRPSPGATRHRAARDRGGPGAAEAPGTSGTSGASGASGA
ncbi:hypothetical protein ACISU4_32135, partial [Streptomyces wuyuanensis]